MKNKEATIILRLEENLKIEYLRFCKDNGYSLSKRIRILLENDMENRKQRLVESSKQKLFEMMEKINQEIPTWLKLINTAEKEGKITKEETNAAYIVDAVKKIAEKFDKFHPEEKKIFRDNYYNNFLKMIKKI